MQTHYAIDHGLDNLKDSRILRNKELKEFKELKDVTLVSVLNGMDFIRFAHSVH